MIKVVGFDVGHTLIKYNNPLNWSSLYEAALRNVFDICNIKQSTKKLKDAMLVLKKYNTRENYREIEYSSNVIFGEILKLWNLDLDILEQVKSAFYSYFQSSSSLYDDIENVLTKLKEQNIKVAILTDVAYGMENKYSLSDIKTISNKIDYKLTSIDVGFRKPNEKGYKLILNYFNIEPEEMIYVGDEEKDIIGANKVKIKSALIDRNNTNKNFQQLYTLNSLNDIFNFM